MGMIQGFMELGEFPFHFVHGGLSSSFGSESFGC